MLCCIFCTNSLSFYSYCCKTLTDENDGSPQKQTLHNERLETNIWEPPVPRLSNVHFHVQLPEEQKCDCGYCVCGRERERFMHTHTCTCTCAHIHTRMHTCTCACTHTCTHMHMCMRTCTHMRVCMHTCTCIITFSMQ